MNTAATALNTYEQNVLAYQQHLNMLKAKRSRIGWLRLLIMLLTIALVYMIWLQPAWIILMVIGVGMAVFLYIVSVDVAARQLVENLARLLCINQEEMNILHGDYHRREDGKMFEPANHAYAQDLDIFGTASMYQYINRCTAEQSRHMLAAHLLHPQKDILQTQQAAKELAPKTAWRQQFQAYGMENGLTGKTEQRILDWVARPTDFQRSYWHWVSRLFPVFTLGCVAMYGAGVIPSALLSLIVFFCFLTATFFSKKIQGTYVLLSKTVDEINTLNQQLTCLEKEHFTCEMMVGLQKKIASKDGQQASKEILRLKNILNRFEVRLNVFAFFFLNTFLLWDVWQMLALNKWKIKNSNAVPNWFGAIAQTEVVSSIAALSFNHPSWCFPKIAEDHFTLRGMEIGHPLINAVKRIDNNFATAGTAKVALITGSNMGGKSTFLRSIGVNTVLALMGAPVCAKSFTVSPVRLMSSMRIADNLSENTSTFYAELKKLQQIIEAVNRKEKIFILLDEILRGTNSLDRHAGSKALIKQLIKEEAVGIIATHDVELTVLYTEYPQSISNYHFDVQVDNNDELFFDFKLKDGICQSMNASILMRKIGIEVK